MAIALDPSAVFADKWNNRSFTRFTPQKCPLLHLRQRQDLTAPMQERSRQELSLPACPAERARTLCRRTNFARVFFFSSPLESINKTIETTTSLDARANVRDSSSILFRSHDERRISNAYCPINPRCRIAEWGILMIDEHRTRHSSSQEMHHLDLRFSPDPPDKWTSANLSLRIQRTFVRNTGEPGGS